MVLAGGFFSSARADEELCLTLVESVQDYVGDLEFNNEMNADAIEQAKANAALEGDLADNSLSTTTFVQSAKRHAQKGQREYVWVRGVLSFLKSNVEACSDPEGYLQVQTRRHADLKTSCRKTEVNCANLRQTAVRSGWWLTSYDSRDTPEKSRQFKALKESRVRHVRELLARQPSTKPMRAKIKMMEVEIQQLRWLLDFADEEGIDLTI